MHALLCVDTQHGTHKNESTTPLYYASECVRSFRIVFHLPATNTIDAHSNSNLLIKF